MRRASVLSAGFASQCEGAYVCLDVLASMSVVFGFEIGVLNEFLTCYEMRNG